jgi:nitrite reductase/ring-hydroxylating ferredoxin subunit/uncharacterized membrane protein
MRSRAHIKSHPIHPMLVVFPIGLWIAALVFDAAGIVLRNNLLWAAGYYALIGGAIGAVAAAIPGVIDLLRVVPPKSSGRRRGLMHGGLNTVALLIFAYVIFHRGSPVPPPDGIAMALQLLGVGIVGLAGWMGGTLVYRNQIGVDHRYAGAGKWRERFLESWDQPVCNQGELAEGQMMLAHIEGKRIVVGRCADGFFAFSDHCTHKGGPLADGALVGCTVQCPWHGSQFDIRSGRVVAGPAEDQIEAFQVYIRRGEIYVMPPGEAPAKAA